MAEQCDLVVVGAGWFGLVAAKVYIELHPNENVVVLESSGSCGGTWSEDRIYPGLKSNNLFDSYEYPDFPMSPEVYGVQPGEHIPGAVLHRYLTDFAKKFGVFSRARFNTKVESVTPGEKDTWILQTSSKDGNQTFKTKKLIIATGLTSTPNFPKLPGAETFKGPVFHAKDFCRNGETVKTAQNAVVIGGAKSAFDVAYSYAENGAQVDLVLREKGSGPVWLAPPYVDFGLRLEKLLQVRLLTCFNPCPWGPEGGYKWLRDNLHGTTIGRKLVDGFYNGLSTSIIGANAYASHDETKKLQPWNSPFWIASGLSINNYDVNFFEMVRKGKIRVHVGEVDHLTADSVYLDNGDIIKADVVCCSTGWKKESSLKYLDFPSSKISLPYSAEEQKILNIKADNQILSMFPRLKDQPTLKIERDPNKEPYRLYRFIVPPTMVEKRNVAFAGMVSTVNTSMCASVQALWISAFLDGKLERLAKSQEEITEEVMLHTQFGKWRYPCGYGANLPDFVFDALPYSDLLLRDMGLNNWRKPNAFKELLAPYGPSEYRGLVDEYIEKHGRQ